MMWCFNISPYPSFCFLFSALLESLDILRLGMIPICLWLLFYYRPALNLVGYIDMYDTLVFAFSSVTNAVSFSRIGSPFHLIAFPSCI